jgi:hypothetical protein
MVERFPVYQYEIRRPDRATETRWSFVPLSPGGYAGNDEPSDAHPMGNEPADLSQMQLAGHVEAPDGSTITSMEPPMLEIPGRGSLDLNSLIQPERADAPQLGHLVRWLPR